MWLKYSIEQLNLFPDNDFSLSPEEQRKRDLQVLPGIHRDYMIGPLYHGSPHAKAILNDPSFTGLATQKIPMFGGINTPMHSGLYFGTVPDIAEAYAVGDVNGAVYYEIINEIDDILDAIHWTKEDILNSNDEDDYYKFERDIENHFYEGDAYSLNPSQIADIIWNYIRSGSKDKDNSGVISFRSPISDILPDEDLIYSFINYGPKSLSSYRQNLGKIIDNKYVNEFYEKTLKYMAEDLERYIIKENPEFQNKIAIAKEKSEDIYELIERLINIMKQRYYDENGNIDQDYLDAEFIEVEDEEVALNLQVVDDFLNAIENDVLHALGIISLGAVGKGATSPITKEQFPERKVRLMDPQSSL